MKKRTCNQCKALSLHLESHHIVCLLGRKIELHKNDHRPLEECAKPKTWAALEEEIGKMRT